jgi:coenzyme F420-0:L-glutamate ligase/coenzyme F420-1:gamma-L-glutamate ligase
MTTDQKLAASIGERQSIRRYLPEPLERPVIERLLAAAMRAPSTHNRQPWRFAVLDDDASKRRLAEAMGERLRTDRTADGDDVKAIDADVSRSYARITGAPVVVVVCVDIRDMDHYPDDRRNGAEYLMAVQSTAMAAQNLLLAAQSEGLGACVMCAPLFCPDTVTDALELPREWTAQMLVTIGAPGRPGKERPRLPLGDIVSWPPHRRTPSSG